MKFLSLLTISVIVMICFLLVREHRWKGADEKAYSSILQSDGVGYYMYLPNIFIHRNLSHQPIDNRYVVNVSGKAVNRYFAGTALAELPFFIATYVCTPHRTGMSGFEPVFQKAISYAALFYLVMGLLFFRGLLLLYNINHKIIAAVMMLLVFGTNLLIYSVMQPSFSHVYSFAFCSMFLFFTKKFFVTEKINSSYFAAFALGMVILIRPINGILIFAVPFLAGSIAKWKETWRLFCSFKIIFINGLIFSCVMAIQLLLWHRQSGHFLLWTYGREGFNFDHPHIWNVLFSFRKGWFIYTPLMLVSMFGLFTRKSKYELITLFAFVAVVIYFVSSWWNWYYGPSFSQRPLIEFYAVFGLLLAFLFEKFHSRIKAVTILAFCLMFTFLNLIQSYQYAYRILSAWDMDFAKYRLTFLKTSLKYSDCLGGNNDLFPSDRKTKLLYRTVNDFEQEYDHWQTMTTEFSETKQSTVCDYDGKEYNTKLEIPADQLVQNNPALYLHMQLDKSEASICGCSCAWLCISLADSQKAVYYNYSFPLNKIPTNHLMQWSTTHYNVELPKINSAGDWITVEVCNGNKAQLYIDNFQVELFGLK